MSARSTSDRETTSRMRSESRVPSPYKRRSAKFQLYLYVLCKGVWIFSSPEKNDRHRSFKFKSFFVIVFYSSKKKDASNEHTHALKSICDRNRLPEPICGRNLTGLVPGICMLIRNVVSGRIQLQNYSNLKESVPVTGSGRLSFTMVGGSGTDRCTDQFRDMYILTQSVFSSGIQFETGSIVNDSDQVFR